MRKEVSARLLGKTAGLVGCLLVMLALAACAGGAPSPRPSARPSPSAESQTRSPVLPGRPPRPAFPEPQGSIPIALLLPLSGPQADTGKALLKAVELAFFDASDPRLRILVQDTGGTAQGARRAAERAVAEGVRVVIGPLLSQTVTAAAPVLERAGIPTLALTSDTHTARPGLWPLGFAPEADVAHILRIAAAHGHKRLAALLPETAYGERVLGALGPALRQTGMAIVALARYLPDAAALDGPARRIARYDERHRALLAERAVLESLGDDLSQEILAELEKRDTLGKPGFDALLLAEGDPLIRSLAPLLAYYDVDAAAVRFLGTGLWDDPVVLREPNLRGAWFPAPDPKRPHALIARLEKRFGGRFPRIATLAYDAMALVAFLAREADVSRRLTVAAFTDPRGFIGIDGPLRLHPDGRVERHLAVLEIRRGGFAVIAPADPHFLLPPVS